ncbi:acyltransferase [Bradyrhizobium sp. MOS003]|uniref:acyltransferase family protein n=1 Tax=Bradyrhizobium sp. MOS003 TaxID=2133946 RepID=UPI000D1223A2|nr:acyltransferase [Bradyrhizobium sp. MOS003]PSO16465.1 hypothetical protein C7G42_23360 [Bradyrhizobium sp. MOS003]
MLIDSRLLRKSLPSDSLSIAANDWPARSGQTIPSLDGLRAGSVMLVLLGHLILPSSMIGISALGLDVFFLVSGFLITRLFFAEARESGHLNLRAFYLRRIVRLYPVLFVYLAIVLTVQTARGGDINTFEVSSVLFYFWNYLTAHQEIVGDSSILPIGVLWSLSVEEHFYLFAPLAFICLRGSPLAMLRATLAVCAATLLLRYLYCFIWPGIEKTLWIYRHSETRADSIAYGAMLACLVQINPYHHIVKFLAGRTAFVIGTMVLLSSYAIRDPYFQNTLRFTIQGLALIPMLCGVVFGQPFPFLNSLLNQFIVRWIGQISYSVYVWHGGIIFLFSWWLFQLPNFLNLFLQLALTFVLAACSYYVVERPALKLRKLVRTSPSSGKTATAAPELCDLTSPKSIAG